MRDKIHIIVLLFFLFISCSENKNYDVAISNLEDRLISLNEEIININLDINRLDNRITDELTNLVLVDDSSIEFSDNSLPESTIKSVVVEEEINFVDPENLFKETYSIHRLSKLTCSLTNKNKNKNESFYNGDFVKINNDGSIEEYKILDINRSERYIKIKSINYNREFNLYTIDSE